MGSTKPISEEFESSNRAVDPQSATTDGSQEELKARIIQVAKHYAQSERVLRPTVVMVAALFVGPNEEKIAQVTGETREYVAEVGELLRLSRLSDGEKVNYSDWSDDRDGWLQFLLDVSVAEGTVMRTDQKRDGKYIYRSLVYRMKMPN